MGGMSTRNEIKARLGVVAESPAKSRKLRAGIMDRLGAAYGALTASPADPTSPQYKQQLVAARKQAQDAVANYKFMRDKAKARQDAMDRYVTAAIKTINASTNVRDVEHFTEQVQIAVRALVTMQSSVKTPFARAGAKAEFGGSKDAQIRNLLNEVKWSVAKLSPAAAKKNVAWLVTKAESLVEPNTPADLRNRIRRAREQMSRPGAKAKMAAHAENVAWMRSLPTSVVNQVRSILQKPHSSARAKQLRAVLKAGGVAFNQWVPDASAGAEVLGHQFREAFAKTVYAAADKPGRKVMAESDPAVSAKIRKLMAEGKPQKQAVAIALDMKRRGEI